METSSSPTTQEASYESPGKVTYLPTAPRIRYALLRRRGVDVVVVLVPEQVLDDPLQCACAAARAYLVFHVSTVLVSHFRQRRYGEAESVRAIDGLDVTHVPWRIHSTAA